MGQGVCVSTTHRVLSPAAGSGPRFSIPFKGVKLDADFEDLETVGVGAVPKDVKEQRRRVVERNGGVDDDFTFRKGSAAKTLGEVTLRNRVKSYPDVGERWYPDVLRTIREEQAEARAERASVRGAEGVADAGIRSSRETRAQLDVREMRGSQVLMVAISAVAGKLVPASGG